MNKTGRSKLSLIVVSLVTLAVLVFYFIAPMEDWKTYGLVILLVLVIVDIVLFYFKVLAHPNAIRDKLQQAQNLLAAAPLDVLKKKYQEIYTTYLKLPERDKQNFYADVIKFRQTLETYMKTKLQLEDLLEQAKGGSFFQRKRLYQRAKELCQQLSPKIQERYHLPLAQLHDQLERGV